jgi:hypothetical protein
MSNTVKYILIAVVVLIAAYFGYQWYQKKKAAAPGVKAPAAPAPKTVSAPGAVAAPAVIVNEPNGVTG